MMPTLLRLLAILSHVLVVVLLTVVTQVGGLIHLLCFPFYQRLEQRFSHKTTRVMGQILVFLTVYLLSVLIIVPLVAPRFGRVALPVYHTDLQPQHWLTVLAARNYVRPALRRAAIDVAVEMKRQHQSTLLYLDAQHPFGNGWPLIPHLSHSDGRKLDVALLWQDARTGKPVSGTPSPIGYGVFEDPRPDEYDRAAECAAQGHWQYGYMEKVVPQDRKPYFTLDEARTAAMTRLFCKHRQVRRVLIEPYLKKRLLLEDLTNLRHHGCNAVRHDDHIHVELKVE